MFVIVAKNPWLSRESNRGLDLFCSKIFGVQIFVIYFFILKCFRCLGLWKLLRFCLKLCSFTVVSFFVVRYCVLGRKCNGGCGEYAAQGAVKSCSYC